MKIRENLKPAGEDTFTYKYYSGSPDETMPKIISDGRTPISVAGVMQMMLEMHYMYHHAGWGRLPDRLYEDHNIWTGDALILHPDGKAKIVLDAQFLREIKPWPSYKDYSYRNLKRQSLGDLPLPDGLYEKIEGLELSKEEFRRYVSPQFRRGETHNSTILTTKGNPIWKFLSRNQTLLDNYIDYAYARLANQYNSPVDIASLKSMDILSYDEEKIPQMYCWEIGSNIGTKLRTATVRMPGPSIMGIGVDLRSMPKQKKLKAAK